MKRKLATVLLAVSAVTLIPASSALAGCVHGEAARVTGRVAPDAQQTADGVIAAIAIPNFVFQTICM